MNKGIPVGSWEVNTKTGQVRDRDTKKILGDNRRISDVIFDGIMIVGISILWAIGDVGTTAEQIIVTLLTLIYLNIGRRK